MYSVGWAETGYWGLDFRDGLELDYSANGSYSTELFASRAEKIISEHNTSQVCCSWDGGGGGVDVGCTSYQHGMTAKTC